MAIFAGGIAGLGTAGMGAASNAARLTPAAMGLRAKGLGGNVPGHTAGRQGAMKWGDFKPLVTNAKKAAGSRVGSLLVAGAVSETYSQAKKEWNNQRRKNR